jgi:hypothetical protein
MPETPVRTDRSAIIDERLALSGEALSRRTAFVLALVTTAPCFPACIDLRGTEAGNGGAGVAGNGGAGAEKDGGGGTWPGGGGTGASTEGGDADTNDCGNGKCEPDKGESAQSCAIDCACGNGTCDAGESCQSCPADCPPGGTKNCYDNGLHDNCCHCCNGTKEECLACNNELNCPEDEYAAYCDRFSPGDNLWQQYHRNWVKSQCGGGTVQSDGKNYYCTDASTCTTYTCPL